MKHLIVCAGMPGSGKTTVAKTLHKEIESILLRSDVLRKEFEEQPNYSQEWKQTYYNLMFKKAKEALENKKNIIMDATFNKKSNRDTAKQLAEELWAIYAIIEITANEKMIKARIEKRQQEGNDVSDANFDVYLLFKEKLREPIEENEWNHIMINNSWNIKNIDSIVKNICKNFHQQ